MNSTTIKLTQLRKVLSISIKLDTNSLVRWWNVDDVKIIKALQIESSLECLNSWSHNIWIKLKIFYTSFFFEHLHLLVNIRYITFGAHVRVCNVALAIWNIVSSLNALIIKFSISPCLLIRVIRINRRWYISWLLLNCFFSNRLLLWSGCWNCLSYYLLLRCSQI